MRSLGVRWSVGVDGIGLPLVLLTAVLTPLAIIGAWRRPGEKPGGGRPGGRRPPVEGYLALLLVLEAALLGVFAASTCSCSTSSGRRC